MPKHYNLKNIRTLLIKGFTTEELRRICYDEDPFRPVYDELAEDSGKTKIIDLLIEHSETRVLLDDLLALAKHLNPARYESHQPYYDNLPTPTHREYGTSSTAVNPSQDSAAAGSLIQEKGVVYQTEPPSRGDKMKDFFVSYNGKDKTWAEWIAWQLEEAGYSTIIQAWDFRPGGNFALDMQRAATQAKRTIAVLSQNYLDALYTQPEWAAAFAQDPTGSKKTLLPVRIQTCELEGMLSQIVYIDLIGLGGDAARQALLEGLKTGRAKPTTEPGFPGEAAPSARATEPPFPQPTTSAQPPAQQPSPATTLPRFKQVKLKTLENRLEALIKQYEAASQQLNSTLAAADKVVIQQQIQNLDQEMQAAENEINQLKGSA